MAERDPRPGDDIWHDKIIPAIAECSAMIVLWTAQASADPARILREAEHARRLEKKIMAVVEQGVAIPDELRGSEYMVVEGAISAGNMVELARIVRNHYKRGAF